ncbi:MAG: hypothetical protein IPM59_12755 [Chloracidobacterium sp.]|nr:hypothetical protein [Chloracidobacterium sp.]
MKYPTKKPEKDFDAVKMMREIRDKLSREIMNMTYEEEKAYLKRRLEKGRIKKAA